MIFLSCAEIVYIEVMSFDQLVKIVAERKSSFVS